MSTHRPFVPVWLLGCALGAFLLALPLWAEPTAGRDAGPSLTLPARTPAPPGEAAPPGEGRLKDPIVRAVNKAKGAVVNIQCERGNGLSDRREGGEHGTAETAVPHTHRRDLSEIEESTPNASTQNRASGMGTGVVIDPRGYIVTNHHVIEDVHVIRVRTIDGQSYPARVFARAKEHDLAILKIDAKKPLPTIQIGTSTDLLVGETVLAIGNAYGYEHTVSKGIISALKRDVSLNRDVSYRSLIQTDAAINPGNSGGPLLNTEGELIGVVTAIRAGAQGIGFAIPADLMVQHVSEMLVARRRADLTPGFVCRNEIDTAGDTPRRSVRVERVDPTSVAGKAGLKEGDVLIQAGEVPLASTVDLERALLGAKAGEKLPLKVLRNDREHALEFTLHASNVALTTADLAWRQLGVKLSPAPAELVTRSHPNFRGGMLVTEVLADGPADKAKIRKGDILVGLHKWETVSSDNVGYVLSHQDLPNFYPLQFYTVRGGELIQGKLGSPD